MKQNYLNLKMPVRYAINTVIIIGFLVAGYFITQGGMLSRAQNNILIQVGIFIILAVSLNLSAGYLGQLPLGHAGFMAVGAYSGAIFWRTMRLAGYDALFQGYGAVLGGLVLAGLVAALFGVLIGIPALRLRGDYLAIITLGFGEMIRVLIMNLPHRTVDGVQQTFTGGAQGLHQIPRHSSFIIVFACVVICCIVIHMMMKSRHGRAILAIRDNEIATESMGINTTYYKVMAFALSAFFAGVAGALWAGNVGILVPSDFDFMMSINILMIVVLGGMGSMMGSIVGATVLTSLPLLMRELSDFRMIIYALLLILVMIFKPSGLMGKYDFSLSHIIGKTGGFLMKKDKEGGTPSDNS